MEASNPYAAPSSAEASSTADPASFVELVRAWEKMRVLYNIILLLPGLVILALWIFRVGIPWIVGIGGTVIIAIAANLAFFLAPLAELYFRALFRQGTSIGRGRWLIFGAGILVSSGVFLMALVAALTEGP